MFSEKQEHGEDILLRSSGQSVVKEKADVVDTFIKFKALVETQIDRKIKVLRTDNESM